ncbi:clustered mitochondria protein homolog [Ctenocephalides felis]|uniref:clustered mitochondria protein homolog n=1 Tax=Ctenocephalides felis TaxID=7515 RepID=UPI000E6E2184|nr:clustered mitochondria protein homolog [Ctenocephalides felis]
MQPPKFNNNLFHCKFWLGENHDKTKESSDCLRHLTQQAVVLQKKMNDLYTGKPGSGAGLPPVQIQQPSMGSVLDMLNVINGILFVQISQQDIEHFKAEMDKRQKESSSSATATALATSATTSSETKEEATTNS